MAAMDLDDDAPLTVDDTAADKNLGLDWLDDEPISPCSVLQSGLLSPAATPRAAASAANPWAKTFALDSADKFPEPVHVTPERPRSPFSDEELDALKAFAAESPRGPPLSQGFFSPPPTPRAPDVLGYLAAAATKPFSRATLASQGARGLAAALGRGLAAHASAPGMGVVSAKCHALVERAATLPLEAAEALRDLCGAYPIDERVADLETFVDVASQEATRAASDADARRAAWRPLAKWRALHRRDANGDAAAAAALGLWSDVAGAKFDVKTKASDECKTVASALAAALSAAVTPADAASADPEALRALGRGGHAVVKRAFSWTAHDVAAVVAIAKTAPTGLDQVAAFVAALSVATARGKRPATLGAEALLAAAREAAEPALAPRARQAKVLLDHVAANAAASGAVFMTGVDAYAYDPATFASSARAMRLGRTVAAALAPVKAERFKNFGADTDSQFLWRFDAAAAAALAKAGGGPVVASSEPSVAVFSPNAHNQKRAATAEKAVSLASLLGLYGGDDDIFGDGGAARQ
mmetsp:Transcript_2449/g.7237  ORF Transcript_2449/g.7237 Transcript_2449/m.7237 type:complete len:529 (-) Transcript_2449:38-1624(-)